jgi:predicted enzyme related to lactoylglutathione lyase
MTPIARKWTQRIHQPGDPTMDTAPRLSHVGLYVHDVPKMIDFYTQVLGFVVSDGAEDGRITFLSRNPSDHHQVVLVRGRTIDAEVPMVQQVSFNVGSLPQVQKAFRKVCDAGCEGISPICHGNAWSVYFQDPEGNRIEMLRAAAVGFQDRPRQAGGHSGHRNRSLLPR